MGGLFLFFQHKHIYKYVIIYNYRDIHTNNHVNIRIYVYNRPTYLCADDPNVQQATAAVFFFKTNIDR